MSYKVIAFDADDTLWDNEHYFKQNEDAFCELLCQYLPGEQVLEILNTTSAANLSLYGFGIKGFVLSMIEACLKVSDGRCSSDLIRRIIELGKTMLDEPVGLLEGVEEVLAGLRDKYRLIVATKGDLLDQERKLSKSGLLSYFHHVEIMSAKNEKAYTKLVKHLDVVPAEFLMVGNSLKSDVIPVLNIGAHAIHIPYHITSIHERVEAPVEDPGFRSLSHIRDLLQLL